MTNGPVRRMEPSPIGASASPPDPPSADHAVWRIPGIFKADATKVAAELDQLGWRRRALPAREILEYARDPTTELHGCFEWDDAQAAEHARLATVRRVVALLRVEVVVMGEEKPRLQRIAVHVQPSGAEPGGYMPIRAVARDEARSLEAMAAAVRDLRAWLGRYRELESRLPVAFGSVRAAVESLVDVGAADIGGES